jgi:hypothetical protein
MLSQSQITYDLVAERNGELEGAAAEAHKVCQAQRFTWSTRLRRHLGGALIAAGVRVRGGRNTSFTTLAPAGSES